MAITSTTIFSGAYTTIKDFINTNVTDPRRRFKKQWVHPSEPNPTDQNFDGYPYVIVQVGVDEDVKAFDRSTSNKNFNAFLTIESDQATEVDSIADQIISKFKDETLTNSLSEFRSIELDSSDFDFRLVGGRKIHRRLIGIIGVIRI
jgi:hypothetical protein